MISATFPLISVNIRYMQSVIHKALAFVLSYFIGCILTGEIVAHAFAHKSVAELGGSGNPGMANIMELLGFKAGILVLIGDLAKCGIAMALSYLLFPQEGRIIVYYAGLGASFGHSFPFWRHFNGGKAVATSCFMLFVYSPLWGLAAMLFGLAVSMITGYLSLAGIAIPFFFLFPAWFVYGKECFVLTVVLFFLCFFRHYPYGRNFPAGVGKRTYVHKIIYNKLKEKANAEPAVPADSETKD